MAVHKMATNFELNRTLGRFHTYLPKNRFNKLDIYL